MEILLQFLLVLAFLATWAQVKGVIRLKRSEITRSYLINTLVYTLAVEILIYTGVVSGNNKIIILAIVNLALWENMIKYSLGLIQEHEIALYNRIEHFLGGFLMFYALYIIGVGKMLPIRYLYPWFEAAEVMLIVNFLSVIHEIIEMIIDKRMKKKYLVGPDLYDTNLDLLMTWSGSIAGALYVIFAIPF